MQQLMSKSRASREHPTSGGSISWMSLVSVAAARQTSARKGSSEQVSE